jgi:hypothetical protein
MMFSKGMMETGAAGPGRPESGAGCAASGRVRHRVCQGARAGSSCDAEKKAGPEKQG